MRQYILFAEWTMLGFYTKQSVGLVAVEHIGGAALPAQAMLQFGFPVALVVRGMQVDRSGSERLVA